ncbi:MAG: DUF6782 family putative metallopeptidase, partial [Thermodesulfobacteriota bacterium]
MDGDPEELFERILLASPVPVENKDIKGTANGYYVPKEKKIVLSSNLQVEQRVKTLLHELAHHFVFVGLDDNDSNKPDRSTGEV